MLITRFGKDCCGTKLNGLICIRAKNHHGNHESMLWKAESMDSFDYGAEAMKEIVNKYLATHGWFLAGQAKSSIAGLDLPKYDDVIKGN